MRQQFVSAAVLATLVSGLAVPAAAANHGAPQIANAGVAPARTAQSRITVPGGTPLNVSVIEPISSNSAKVGDTISFKATEDVAVDGWIVVAKDALGEGEVTVAEGAGSNGHPGKLGLKFNWIFGADGMKILLTSNAHTANAEGNKGAASTATIASYALLGPVGLFAHNWVRGKDVTVAPTAKLPVYVDHTVHIVAKNAVDSQPNGGFAR